MKGLLYTLAIIIFAASVALFMRQDPGYVLISVQNYTVELSLALLVVGILLFTATVHYSLKAFSKVISAPKALQNWQVKRINQKANVALKQGLLAESQGAWKQAEKNLITHVRETETPMINYLAAARVAQAQGASERRDLYLKKAYEAAPKGDIAVELTQAELQIEEGQYEQALATLNHVYQLAPKNTHVLRLMARLHQDLGEWEKLVLLIPVLEQRKALPAPRLETMTRTTNIAILKSAIESGDSVQLHNAWNEMPKSLRHDVELLTLYLQALVKKGDHQNAARYIDEQLKQFWNDDLVRLYGRLELPNTQHQLKVAEDWLPYRKDNPVLLLTLGRLCEKLKLWGKARAYLESATRFGRDPEAFYTLARLLEGMGEKEQSAVYYRKGLALVFNDSIVPEAPPLKAVN